ncbi:MAG: replication-associated recombination protein A [Dehalococcoidales bacterium]|nr:replication-associated recombination protein A [Dehalococcoidales bacterium]
MDIFEHRFEEEKQREAPLAARMRPGSLDDFIGQKHIVGKDRVLRKAIESGQVPSIILWGPPGSGKTTLANIVAGMTNSRFTPISAVNAGVADLRKAIEEALERRKLQHQKTILFIDEIHRFNKAQQDAILPFVEDGTISLIGATTENPSFAIIAPLLSRSRVFTLKPLTNAEIEVILQRAIKDKERGLGALNVEIDADAVKGLVEASGSDARVALNALEIAVVNTLPAADGKRHITLAAIEDTVQQKTLLYDKTGDQHYDIISALIKSIRGSDPDAAIYWLARILEAGEDPLFIARRLVILASEDVGMADPQALIVAVTAQQAVQFVGMPECRLNLAETVIYLATAPKSNSAYSAYAQAQEEVKHGRNEPVPLHLRNPVTGLMKALGYGKDYKYAHNYEGHFIEQQFLPDALKQKHFYMPSAEGFESTVLARLKRLWPHRFQDDKK